MIQDLKIFTALLGVVSRIKYAVSDFYSFDNLGRYDFKNILTYGV